MFIVKIKAPNAANIETKLQKVVTQEFANQVQDEVVDGIIKKLIRAGTSPIVRFGRFVAYKDKDIYPGKRKGSRPVNLTLTGEMLREYKAEVISGRTLRIGISQSASEFVKIKAQANNLGTTNEGGGIQARRFVPVGSESFAVSVMRKLKDLYARRIKDILSR